MLRWCVIHLPTHRPRLAAHKYVPEGRAGYAEPRFAQPNWKAETRAGAITGTGVAATITSDPDGAVLVVPAGGLEARRATAGHTMTGAIADLLLG